MRKLIIALFSAILILYCASTAFGAQVAGPLTSAVVGRVIEVLDADAIAVKLLDGKIAYVRLLGVDASTKEDGLQYMYDVAFGRVVTVVPDYSGAASGMDGRFSYGYVYLSPDATTNTKDKEMLNLSLIKYGYAEVDQNFKGISSFNTLSAYQTEAKALNTGLWNEGQSIVALSRDKVNINTATFKSIRSFMTEETPDTLIYNILSYRSTNPFNSVSELKFVKGMTKEIYSNNRHVLSVITNLNTATEKELRTLDGATSEIVESILKYRSSHTFNSLTDLHREANISEDFYDKNRYYISVNSSTEVTRATPAVIVNLNTASATQLRSISSLDQTLVSRIIVARNTGYTFKTISELRNYYDLSDDGVNSLEDNLNIYTDVNLATYDELESLFGSDQIKRDIDNIVSERTISNITELKSVLNAYRYDRIKDHIYASTLSVPERINLNTASEAELRGIGLSMWDAREVMDKQGKMLTPSQIPISVSSYDKKISLYTNVNTATVKELRSLNVLSESSITQLVAYRDDQPFGSLYEVEEFFEDMGMLNAFNKIEDFIVVR